MQWLLIHVSNCATFVSTICIHVWAPISTLAYYFEGFPQLWHYGNTPMMSLGVWILSPTVISFGTNSNTPLFIWFNPYLKLFLLFQTCIIFLLVGQVNFIHFKTIAAIAFNNSYRSNPLLISIYPYNNPPINIC